MWYPPGGNPCIAYRQNHSKNDHGDFDDDHHGHNDDHNTFVVHRYDFKDDYDIDVSMDSNVSKPVEIFLFVFLLIVIIVGVVGNFLILVIVFTQRKNRTTSSCYVASLAFVDIIVLLTCGVLHCVVTTTFAFDLDIVEIPPWIYQLFLFIHMVSKGVTCYTLVALTIDRYLHIVHPILSRRYRSIRHAVVVSLAVWIGSLLYSCIISILRIDELFVYAIVFLTEYVFPLIVSATFYVIIIRKFWQPGPHIVSLRRGSNGGDENRRQKIGLLRMVLVALVVFGVTVGVHHGMQFSIIIISNNCQRSRSHGEIKLLTFLSHTALFVNSALNPFVYGLTNSLYASALKSLLCFWRTQPRKLMFKTVPEIYRKFSKATIFLGKSEEMNMSDSNGNQGYVEEKVDSSVSEVSL
ncbi:G-protein coupled receptor 54-like isoform X1 [Lytechinus pictus]|uniref:G-protein coupled receptor 54-like isoform X1 n=2 Tax=Lytechinus pictus TaxID=7653 RepID=UPI00240DB681|nr:G-protein coupled receptor 54-like [Lytechinus pictus]